MNIKKLIKYIIVPMPLVILLIYISGIIAQLMFNYKIWESTGGEYGTSPTLPNINLIESLKSVLIFPYGIYGILITVFLFTLFLIFGLRIDFKMGSIQDKDRNLIYSNKGTHGTAGFMQEKEISSVLNKSKNIKNDKGTIVGELNKEILTIPLNSRMNKNIAVYGASGTMKSRAYARNKVFQCVKREESLVITDPKSELFEDMSVYLKNNGYKVKVFNLVNPEHSDSFNVLSEVNGDELMAQVLADVIIKNTGGDNPDMFWDSASLNLLKALILYVDSYADEENKNLGEVYRLLTSKNEQELNAIFKGLEQNHSAQVPYHIFKQSSEGVRTSIIIGLGSKLQVFQSKLIREITNYNEIDLTQIGKEKCAYFCIISDQDSTFDFLSSLFMSFLFIKLVRYADKYGDNGKLPTEVHILADELANIGVIPDLKKKISTIRSRGLSMSIIFQNIAQMQNRYPKNEWLELIGNCDTQIFLGCTDELTAEFISNRTGVITTDTTTTAKELNTYRLTNYTPKYRESVSVGKRMLLTPDEVLRLPLDTALIILRGQKVLKVKKYDYLKNDEAKKLVKSKVIDYIPKWRKKSIPIENKVEKNKLVVKYTKSSESYEEKKNFKPKQNKKSVSNTKANTVKSEKKQISTEEHIESGDSEQKIVEIKKEDILID